MKKIMFSVALAAVFGSGCCMFCSDSQSKHSTASPARLNMRKAKKEVKKHYSKAHPEVQEYILWTARTFGRSGRWLNEDAFASLSEKEREEKVKYIADLLNNSEYGRHLCMKLAEASAIKDKRLVPGLIKVAGYSKEFNYDCRPKWMAVAALSRQESDDAVPLLISLVDHGNQNTRMWARAALARKSKHDFGKDKQAWNKWWQSQGHNPIDKKLLKPYTPPRPFSRKKK